MDGRYAGFAGAKPPPLATERDQDFMSTVGALHPQESVLQPSAFEVIGKFLLHMQGQGLALHGHHIPELRVMLLQDTRPRPYQVS